MTLNVQINKNYKLKEKLNKCFTSVNNCAKDIVQCPHTMHWKPQAP